MFGISFSEIFIIAIVALLVVGPEKLPKVARTIGALTGRMQRYAAQVKEEVNREFRFEELQKLQEEIKQAVINTEQSVQQQVANVEHSIADLSETKIALGQETSEAATTQELARAKRPQVKSTKATLKISDESATLEIKKSAQIEKKSGAKAPAKKVNS